MWSHNYVTLRTVFWEPYTWPHAKNSIEGKLFKILYILKKQLAIQPSCGEISHPYLPFLGIIVNYFRLCSSSTLLGTTVGLKIGWFVHPLAKTKQQNIPKPLWESADQIADHYEKLVTIFELSSNILHYWRFLKQLPHNNLKQP